MALRRLILVADDYAISAAVSAGIRSLAELRRLSATGVMSVMPAWPQQAAGLKDLHGSIAVGLHITLTDQPPLGRLPRLAPAGRLPPVGRLLRRSLAGLLPLSELADEIERQLDRFEAHFGAPPDFIDGHQHVHLLPGVWPIVQSLFGRRLDPARCWWRDCCDPRALHRGSLLKAGGIALLGRAAAAAARQAGLRRNRGFSGFYDYAKADLAQCFAPMLKAAGDGHAMMVHPGHVDQELRAVDSLTEPRQREWEYLSSPAFPAELEALGFRLAAPGFLIDGAEESGHIAAL